MTAVLGLVQGKKIYFGADCMASADDDAINLKSPKIFKVGKFLFGYAGSLRQGQVLRHIFKPPAHPKGMDTEKYMVDKFMSAMVKCFDKNLRERDSRHWSNFCILVGYQGRIFEIYNDLQCCETVEGISGIGSGGIIGKAALFALAGSGQSPIDMLDKALTITESLSVTVRGPFDFVEM